MAARMSKVFKSKIKEIENVSEGYDRRWLAQDHLVAQFGLPGDILAVSFDQIQSLLAVATSKSIHVLGQNGVESVYQVAAGREVAHLLIHGSHLIAIDTKHVLYTWLIEDKTRDPAVIQPLRGVVTATYAEASIDWLFLGMKDGTVSVWDIEGEQIVPSFKIKNQYFERQEDWRLMGEVYAVPRYHISPVIQLCLHPLDLGILLIVYADGACLYSLKEGTTKTFYECIFPDGTELTVQKPPLTCATFSPDGRFVLLGCNDGSLAFFDVSDGEIPLQVRSLEQADINMSNPPASNRLHYNPITSLRWCCRVEPSDSFLLVAGGLPADIDGLTVLDYGMTPSKAQELSEFFGTPQRHKILPISRAQVLDLLPLGTASPFHMSHDPRCVLILAANGHVTTLEVPDGRPVSIGALPPSISICSPPISDYTVGRLPQHVITHLSERTHTEIREKSLLAGGALRATRQQGERTGTVLCTVHEGTMLRIFDIVHDLIVKPPITEIDTTLTMPNTYCFKFHAG
ncbi:Uncharacterized protein C1F3.03 [Taphrina deformans PYCC 5710]|uniref:Uncharacterized protein C1F3.03 n=1 Tax=Taphrina deformans (strain PYCC 5710 / ATCC 11124 / CBS 356.35 / IMI 108563 / JCM 9778 / NBRC 8474) TaxID=1097556 RepID=R4XF29_TAPDE|nr:Uncharacterized protein C1F3.03 [Taphrina deformans PYCC 5710]|eukprot:CCG81967.1 Uncharacterized protein C1F3.03 [Taphrina deformans PYCC 5710]